MIDRAIAEVFLTKKVAEIFAETVEFQDPDRAETDWHEAQKFVRENPAYIDMIAKDAEDDMGYFTFEAKYGEYIWHWAQPQRAHLPRPPYGRIVFF